MSLKLGVFGGMFDPVHLGHISVAKYAAARLELDALKLIPCKTPNHRHAAIASAEHRLRMLQIAIADDSILSVDSIELEREGVSYMVDTLATLKAEINVSSLVLIIGMDSFNSLPKWDRWEKLFELANIFVVARNQEQPQAETLAQLATESVACDQLSQLSEKDRGLYFIDRSFDVAGSSTEVRDDLIVGTADTKFLQGDVKKYILDNHLYSELN